MRCLSLHQPWATLLVHGLKLNETRGPRFLSVKPGPLLIHAAQRWTPQQADLCRAEPFASALLKCGHTAAVGSMDRPLGLPFGAVVGRVEVLAAVPSDNVKWIVGEDIYRGFDRYAGSLVIGSWEKAFGDYTEGRAVLVCEKPEAFPRTMPTVGRQGLFEVPDDVLAEFMAVTGSG